MFRSRGTQFAASLTAAELALGIAALAVIGWHAAVIPWLYADSWAPMLVAREVAYGAEPHAIYKIVFFEREIKFQYPPIFISYFDVLAQMGVTTLRRFHALNLVFLICNGIAIAALAFQLFRDIYPARRRLIALAAFSSSLLYGPIVTAYYIGQIQILINLIFTLSCLAIFNARPGLAGGLLGAACSIKPQFVLLLLSGGIARNWRFCIGFCACGAALGLISLYAFGWTNHIDYLSTLRHLSQRGESYYWNNSVNGILNGMIGNGSTSDVLLINGVYQSQLPPFHSFVYWTSLAAFIGFSALPLAYFSRIDNTCRRSVLLLFTLCAACSVVASPIAWTHHFGILLPAHLICLRCLLELPPCTRRRKLLYLTAASGVLTAAYVPHITSATGPIVLVHAPNFIGACILIYVVAVQLHETRRAGRQVSPA